MIKDYYKVLGLLPQADDVVVKAAYKALAQKNHPDKHSTDKAHQTVVMSEINEAFAIQVLAFLDHFGIADDDKRVNPFGGAIAVGHPLASSGIRLMLNLARSFEEHPEVEYGLTSMCIGLGMGGTVIWQNPHYKKGA